MFFWAHFPFLRMTIFLIGGIYVADHFNFSFDLNPLFLFILIVYAVTQILFNDSKISFQQNIRSFVCLSAFFIFGMALQQSHRQNNLPDPFLEEKSVDAYLAVARSDAEELKRHYRTKVEIIKVFADRETFKSYGQVLVYFPKDDLEDQVLYGDLLLIKGGPSKVSGPLNPEEFDYQKYLTNEHIYYQHFPKADHSKIIKKGAVKDLPCYFTSLRRSCIQIIKDKIKGENERAIALALVLGDKSELDTEIKQIYAASGAMHVLAVSGLHVGMIYGIIIFIFGRIRAVKNGKIIFALIAISILWIYAAITGLPPSVLRAVTMFSVIILSQTFSKQTNIYNSLALAAMALLAYNPFFLFSVGFQLSFLAVTGIVYFFPKIYHLYNPENKYLDHAWAFTCLALSAQFATFPLTIFYFHQFPVYFWLSNLIVIPAAFLFLGGGISVLLLDSIGSISDYVGQILEKIIWIVNQLLFKLETLPHHLIKDLYITSSQALLLYALIFFFVMFFHLKKVQYLYLSIMIASCFSFISIRNHLTNQTQKKIVFYSIPNYTAIDFIEGLSSGMWLDEQLQLNPAKIDFHVKPYKLSLGLATTTEDVSGFAIPVKTEESYSLLVWNNVKILLLEKQFTFRENDIPISVDYLVLRNNQKQNLESIVAKIKFGKLIIDQSNSKYRASFLETEAKRLNLPFHNVVTQGAYIVNL